MYVNPWASLVAQMVKNLSANVGDVSSIPGWERSPGKENGNPPQYSCLENSMDRGASTTVNGESPWTRKESDTTEFATPSGLWGPRVSAAPEKNLRTWSSLLNWSLWFNHIPRGFKC